MCGIAGFIGFSNNQKLAEEANNIQKHRGPDNQSIWSDAYISLSHQRLAIIDLSERSNQPFVKGENVIVFNGEIYNYKELRGLYLIDIDYFTASDTEVVLDMFVKYGEKCLDYFIGMFSFAIYNRSSKEVFAARDHFGIKPFFYCLNERSFAFASELKTLAKLAICKKEINIKSVIYCLNYLWIPGDETMFIGCFKLLPGHFLKLSNDLQLTIAKYWDLADRLTLKNEKDYVLQLENVIKESVKHHMIADVPVSTFLSGGLDSSLISVLAKKENKNLSTYTIATNKHDKRLEGMPGDELYARYLAKKSGFDHHEITITHNIVESLPKMVHFLDEPIGDPAALNTYLICQSARKSGVKVLLSGMGADEIFFGYRRMKATLMAQKFKRYPGFVKSIIGNAIDILPVRFFNHGLTISRWAKKYKTFANLPVEAAYRMSYSYYDKNELSKLLNFEHDAIISHIYDEHAKIFNSKFKGDLINQMCYCDINMFMVGLNLTYTDRASMAASVEVRVPFIDKNVIQAGMEIPGKFKYLKKESKYLLKKAAEKYLPAKIIYRPKASFGAPLRSWISNDLRPMIDDLLSTERINKRGILNAEYVKTLIDRDRAGLEDNAYRLYQLITLELWLKEYVD